MAKAKIASAVGTSSAAFVTGRHALSERIQAAMTKAVEDALAEGISIEDSETIKDRKMAARAAVLAGEGQ